MDVEHYETERKRKDICGLKKLQTTTKQKKLVYFLWKNKIDFACKAMTICQAFRAQCE